VPPSWQHWPPLEAVLDLSEVVRIIGVLKEHEAGARAKGFCWRYGIGSATCLTPGGSAMPACRRARAVIEAP
jgi:hypothetical protein